MRALRRLRAVAGLCLALAVQGSGAGATPAPAVLAGQSEISFVSRQMGVPVAGSFRSFEARVELDPAVPQKGRFIVSVDLSSVALPTADAMQEVVKPEWLDVQRFPRAVFESEAIRALARTRYEIAGRLTIKGHALELTVPVALEQSGSVTFASGSLVVRRLAFSIGEGEWTDTSVIDDDVQIRFRLALTGIGPL